MASQTSEGSSQALPLVILIPVYNDWKAIELLLPRLDAVLEGKSIPAEVLLVDDGSGESETAAFRLPELSTIRAVHVLALRRNLGHQRAIAIGLAHVHENYPGRAVLIMDGDGEDDPEDVPRLLQAAEQQGWSAVVFAARTRRSETFFFQACYRIYQLLHWVLTGYRVEVGNFSIIPARNLDRLVIVSELWNHYSAAVFNARIPCTMIPTVRGRRLAGRTRMNFTGLVVHGLSALSVYNQIIGVRLLIATAALAGVLLAALLMLVRSYWDVPADRSIWPGLLIFLLLTLLLQTVVSAGFFVFLVLAGRHTASFVPLRDYHWFVGRHFTLWKNPALV